MGRNKMVTILCSILLLGSLVCGLGREQAAEPHSPIKGIQPHGISIYPPYDFYADIWTDRDYYYIEDSIKVFFWSSEDAYVYIFDTDTRGITHQIFPNYYDRNNFIQAGITYYIPDQSYDLKVTGPAGREHLSLVAVKKRFHFLDRYHHFRGSEPFPRFYDEPEGLIQKLLEQRKHKAKELLEREWQPRPQRQGEERLRVVPYPHEPPWTPYYYAEAYTSFAVRRPLLDRRWERRIFGRLFIQSWPSRANIYIDDEYQGQTPKIVTVPYGTHEIRVEKSGYHEWYEIVEVDSPTTLRIFARLQLRKYLPHQRQDVF